LKIEKRIHKGWQEYEDKIKGKVDIEPMFKKWQYLLSKDGITISMVEFTPRMYGEFSWEIYQIEGKPQLFEDVERFMSKEKAEERIKELLN